MMTEQISNNRNIGWDITSKFHSQYLKQIKISKVCRKNDILGTK